MFSILVGYGFDSDLKMVVKTYPFLKEPLTHLRRTVDLEKLAAKVQACSKNSGVQQDKICANSRPVEIYYFACLHLVE